MTKKLIIILALLILIIGAFGGTQYLHHKKSNDQSSSTTEATSEVTTEEVTTEETTTEEKSEEATTADKNEAEIEEEGDFDKDDTPPAKRETNEAKELFRLTLQFIEEYDYDSDHFKVVKALIVQNLEVDYVYFQCKHDGKTEYACYTYDGQYFRDSISQKALKKEYDDALVTKDYYDQKEDYNVYYEFSKDEINAVNDMY